MTALHWCCLATGLPGDTCPVTGTTIAAAERHQAATHHGTQQHSGRLLECAGVGA